MNNGQYMDIFHAPEPETDFERMGRLAQSAAGQVRGSSLRPDGIREITDCPGLDNYTEFIATSKRDAWFSREVMGRFGEESGQSLDNP